MLGLRQKLFSAFAGLFLLLLLVAWLAVGIIGRVSRSFELIFHENLETIHACEQMRRAAGGLEEIMLQALVRGEGVDTAEASRQDSAFASNLKFQLSNVTVPGERQLTDSLAAAWGAYRKLYFGLLDSGSAGWAGGKPADRSLAELDRWYHSLEDLSTRIADLNARNILSADGQVRSQAAGARRTILALLLSGGVMVLALLYLASRLILNPLKTLLLSAQEIEKGNLDLALEARSRDELGQLAEAFNSMAARLREFRRSDRAKLILTQRTTQAAINSLPDAIAVLGTDGTVELSNEPAQALFGIKPGTRVDGLGMPWLSELHERTAQAGRPIEPQGYESAVQVFKEGRERFFLPQLIPIRDGARQSIGMTLVLADVTELRRLDESKSDLLATVSHEFKTRLTSFRMAVHLLLDEKVGDLNPRQTELVLAAREDAENLNRLIEGFLDIGRIRAGRLRMEEKPMPAEELVRHALDGVRHAYQDKGLNLELEMPPDPPNVLADPTRVHLIFANLLSNALKYTSAGGTVKVTLEELDEDGPFVAFHVSDTGAGIPAADLPKIFERFYRGVREQDGGGAGLGLAIAREVVEAHGGRLSVESVEGRGSTFTFTLRRAGQGPARNENESQRSAS